jgi:thymidylate synthase
MNKVGSLTLDNLMESWETRMDATAPFDRGRWQAQEVSDPDRVTVELRHEALSFTVGWDTVERLTFRTGANQPWVEEHFQERVSGEPMNPPPSSERWPFKVAGHKDHVDERGEFSHTYPERFWASRATGLLPFTGDGIRYPYGDLEHVLEMLDRDPNTRQAYLPVWFPEDTGAQEGQRVPCTLGYHFLSDPLGFLDVSYFIRSCDLIRHFQDDVYMAARLLQWVATNTDMKAGTLRMYIGSLHRFVGDEAMRDERRQVRRIREAIRIGEAMG